MEGHLYESEELETGVNYWHESLDIDLTTHLNYAFKGVTMPTLSKNNIVNNLLGRDGYFPG